MNLTVFQSDKGDCLLLEGRDGKSILVDGGMSSSFRKHAAPTLARMAEEDRDLDLVYVSHIDQDHISGILRLTKDLVDWRVYDFQQFTGNTHFPKPKSLRPPVIRKIWHNAFRDQLEENAGAIESLLVSNLKFLSAGDQEVVQSYQNLIASEREALLLSHRVGERQLNIPHNPETDGGLIMVNRPREPVRIGGMRIDIIGPFKQDLEDLRKRWNKWVKTHQETIAKIRDEARKEELLLNLDEGESLISSISLIVTELGDRNKVTVPNLASLMLLVEEEGKTILLTGDGHSDEIVRGLKKVKRLDDDGRMHVDVLKVQHHGSEFNTTSEFGSAITADHYVFCGNGAHENPDLGILELFLAARLGSEYNLNPFTFWFNSSAKVTKERYKKHMQEVEDWAKSAKKQSKNRFKAKFIRRGSKFEIPITRGEEQA
jgi:beta-lactamase superfamily II metal-dependent hydrolase